jgi:RNA polymerase sigma-70 factor (ECF subfamily)
MSTRTISFERDVRIVMRPEVREPHDCGGRASHYEDACEVELVSAAQSGDLHAFVELARRYGPSLKRRIRGIVRHREDAEDILQDTLVDAFSHLARFRAKSTFRAWIMTIATNNSLMLLRRRRNHAETELGLIMEDGIALETLAVSDPAPNPEQMYESRQASRWVAQAVSELPVGLRVLIQRCQRDESTLADAAKALGITESAAKSRLYRARNVLRRRLSSKSDPIT